MDNSISLIKTYRSDISEKEYHKIKYGLEGIYLTITKFVIISVLAIVVGIFKEFIFFTILYNVIRMFAFGLHAKDSLWCLSLSSLVFIFIPLLSKTIVINPLYKVILFTIALLLIILFAPADTYKRPLVNKKKRTRLKVAAIIVTIIYTLIALMIKNNLLSNLLLFSILIEVVLILPITYKVLNLPYKNYVTYGRLHKT